MPEDYQTELASPKEPKNTPETNPEIQSEEITAEDQPVAVSSNGEPDQIEGPVLAETPERELSLPSEPSESKPAVEQAVFNPDEKIRRFHLPERLEHWAFMISFTTLAFTGLIQKFSQSPFSKAVIRALGGIETTRTIHHVAAVIMMVVVVYHIGEIFYKLFVNRLRPELLPNLLDARNVWQTLRYDLFLSNKPPQQARYTFEEKAEYWAVVWGTVIMVITGFMMWNPLATTSVLPGEVIPSAKLAHGMEAILAVAAIIIWHFYHVLVKTLNRSMFHGKLTMHQMEEEHPLELADIRAGLDKPDVTPNQRTKRLRVFIPVYAIVAALGVFGIFHFVTLEKTAITTIPQREIATVYAPETPTPFPTPLPTATPAPLPEGGATTWDNGIGNILSTKCGGCHNSASKLGGLDLSSYAGAMSGGKSGPVIVPGDPTNSRLVQIQQAGGHPGQLSGDELTLIINWIQAGAVEK